MEDLAPFFFSYLPMLGVWLAVTFFVGIVIVFARRKAKEPPRWDAIGSIALISVVGWVIYFAATAERYWAISTLDSESDRAAEQAYHDHFKVSLNEALRIAGNDGQSGNVRFYAAFRAADLLATNDAQTVARVLQGVEDVPSFQTGFFGNNRLTLGYFEPGRQEGPFEVKDLIRRRLQQLHEQTNAANNH